MLNAKKDSLGVAIISLKTTLILQLARNDVKIGTVRAHGNRLKVFCRKRTFKYMTLREWV